MSDTTAQVVQMQREWLQRLERCESSIAEFYEEFARRVPGESVFWSGLAREERGHALLVRALEGLLDRGYLFRNVGQIDTARVLEMVDRFRGELSLSPDGVVPAERAFEMALCFETTLVESRVFRILTCDAPEFALIAEHLNRSTQDHRGLIETRLRSLDRAPAP